MSKKIACTPELILQNFETESGEIEPRVDSRWLAGELGLQHSSLTRLLKRYQSEIKELGLFGFEIRKVGEMGRPETFAFLNEDQCYFVLTLSKNTGKVVELKLLLTKEFCRLRKEEKKEAFTARRQAEKEWQENRAAAALEYRSMSRMLELVRERNGKETKHYHYANEAKLVNWALTGEYKPLDRKSLSRKDLGILTLLEAHNAVLIGAGVEREERKELLKQRCQLAVQDLMQLN